MLQGGALDREAAARGTTVYLTDERLDMLPERLSAGLASLLQVCFAVIMLHLSHRTRCRAMQSRKQPAV